MKTVLFMHAVRRMGKYWGVEMCGRPVYYPVPRCHRHATLTIIGESHPGRTNSVVCSDCGQEGTVQVNRVVWKDRTPVMKKTKGSK
jgi:hypothetical protein